MGESERKECAWCATRLPEEQLGQYEVGWTYQHHTDLNHGWYICLRCKNWMENLIQQKVSHTWMVMKARAERPCCGGGG